MATHLERQERVRTIWGLVRAGAWDMETANRLARDWGCDLRTVCRYKAHAMQQGCEMLGSNKLELAQHLMALADVVTRNCLDGKPDTALRAMRFHAEMASLVGREKGDEPTDAQSTEQLRERLKQLKEGPSDSGD